MHVSSPSGLAVAPALSTKITEAANLHKQTVMGFFGKVSPVTGWRAFFRGEFFGHGKMTTLTGTQLITQIAWTHGWTIARKVGQQVGVSESDFVPINSYKVAKAVALVEAESDWTKVHTTEISYARVDESGKAASESTKCKVTLTPLGRLKSLATHRDLFGVASTDTQNENAVNAWVEEMRVGSSATPTTRLVRSGVLVPPSAGDEGSASVVTSGNMTQREKTALNRYQQILSALIETTPSLISNDFKEEENSKENPLEIEHAHIGLLSSNKKQERAMAANQLAFLKKMAKGDPFEINYIKKDGTLGTLWVKPKVLYTNFSVREPQKKGAAAPATGSPDDETEKTLDHYLGKVDEQGTITSGGRALEIRIRKKLIAEAEAQRQGSSNSPFFEKELENSEEWKLLQEVRKLRSTRSQEGSSFYSYEFQTKYSLLLAKCGIPTHVYCKSGKDRTSRFSEMAKMWAANPDLKLNKMTRAVRNVIKAFSFSGNSEVQRLNTGFAGNKQAMTYWRLIAGEKKDRTFGGWTHWLSAGSYSGWGASTIVKT